MEEKYSLEVQYKLLGAYIKNSDLFDPVENLVRHKAKDSIFTSDFTKKSYEIIKAYHLKEIELAASDLMKELTKAHVAKEKCNMLGYMFSFTYLSPGQVKEYTELLFGDYVVRHLTPILNSALENFGSADPIEEMTTVKDAITQIEMVINNVSSEKSIHSVFDETVKRIRDLKDGVIERVGFSFGVDGLDDKTGGAPMGITVIAATPGSGKTSLFINMIKKNVIDDGLPMLFFSLEMPAIEIMTNIISNVLEINSRALRSGDVDEEALIRINELKSKLKENFVIDDSEAITWQHVEAGIKAFRKKHKLPIKQTLLVGIDYIQKMTNIPEESKRMNDEKCMEITCNNLARICKQQNVALVEISQFSRETMKREVPRPKMSDLKGSAAIEQNAILILLMYRPEYHDIKTGKGGISTSGLCEINIAKGRYVHPEPVYAYFEGRYSKFSDWKKEGDIKTDGEDAF